MDSSPEAPRHWLLSKKDFWSGILKPSFFILFASQRFVPQEQTCDANGSKKKCHRKCYNFFAQSSLSATPTLKFSPPFKWKECGSPPIPIPTYIFAMKDMLLDVISCHLHNVFLLLHQIFWRTLSRLYNMSASPCIRWFSCTLVYCLCPSILKENERLFLSYVYLRPSSHVKLLREEPNA